MCCAPVVVVAVGSSGVAGMPGVDNSAEVERLGAAGWNLMGSPAEGGLCRRNLAVNSVLQP